MIVVASLWVGWQRFTHPPVPAALRPWIQHNQGVLYRPAGTALSVSMPSVPQETNVSVAFGPGLKGSARVARSLVGDHEVMVVWLVAPTQALHVPGGDPVMLAADFVARSGGFRILVPSKVGRLKRDGIEGIIEREGNDGRALVLLDGSSIYAVVVSAPHDPEAGFEFLVDSLQLGNP